MPNNWLVPFKGRQCSGVWDQNFLWRDKSVYIMDNHRTALWCWLQHLEKHNKYDLFHIDRHYDTLSSQNNEWLSQVPDLKEISISNYLAIKEDTALGTFPLIRWDNYLSIFLELYGEHVEECIFATHNDGDEPDWENWLRDAVWDIPDILECRLSRSKNKWILNIDLDYFFYGSENYKRMLSDEYAQAVFEVIHKKYQDGTIRVLTIAFSPEYCGGWEPAEHLCQKLCAIMGLEFSLL